MEEVLLVGLTRHLVSAAFLSHVRGLSSEDERVDRMVRVLSDANCSQLLAIDGDQS